MSSSPSNYNTIIVPTGNGPLKIDSTKIPAHMLSLWQKFKALCEKDSSLTASIDIIGQVVSTSRSESIGFVIMDLLHEKTEGIEILVLDTRSIPIDNWTNLIQKICGKHTTFTLDEADAIAVLLGLSVWDLVDRQNVRDILVPFKGIDLDECLTKWSEEIKTSKRSVCLHELVFFQEFSQNKEAICLAARVVGIDKVFSSKNWSATEDFVLETMIDLATSDEEYSQKALLVKHLILKNLSMKGLMNDFIPADLSKPLMKQCVDANEFPSASKRRTKRGLAVGTRCMVYKGWRALSSADIELVKELLREHMHTKSIPYMGDKFEGVAHIGLSDDGFEWRNTNTGVNGIRVLSSEIKNGIIESFLNISSIKDIDSCLVGGGMWNRCFFVSE